MINTIDSLLLQYDFIIQIRNFNLTTSLWQEEFIKKMEDEGFLLENNKVYIQKFHIDKKGNIINRNSYEKYEIADFEFFNKEEVFSSSMVDWECPFLPNIFGYYCIKFNWNINLHTFEEHFIALINESMGIIIAKLNNEILSYPCVAKIDQSISLGKYALEDGDILLSRENPEYLEYIIANIKHELNKSNYNAHIYYINTCHNPLRYNYFVKSSGKEASELYSENEKQIAETEIDINIFSKTIKIWAFNFNDPIKVEFYKVPEQHILWN